MDTSVGRQQHKSMCSPHMRRIFSHAKQILDEDSQKIRRRCDRTKNRPLSVPSFLFAECVFFFIACRESVGIAFTRIPLACVGRCSMTPVADGLALELFSPCFCFRKKTATTIETNHREKKKQKTDAEHFQLGNAQLSDCRVYEVATVREICALFISFASL